MVEWIQICAAVVNLNVTEMRARKAAFEKYYINDFFTTIVGSLCKKPQGHRGESLGKLVNPFLQ